MALGEGIKSDPLRAPAHRRGRRCSQPPVGVASEPPLVEGAALEAAPVQQKASTATTTTVLVRSPLIQRNVSVQRTTRGRFSSPLSAKS